MIQEGKKGPSFEEKLETLEGLVARMEEGGLHLDELVRLYEEGMTLSEALKKDLEGAQARLAVLRAGKLQEAEEASDAL